MPSLAKRAYTLAKRYNCDPYYHYPDDDICYTKPLSRGAALGITIGCTVGFVLFGLFIYYLMGGTWTCCTRARRSSASIQEEEEEEYRRKQRQWDRSLAEAVRQHQMIRQHFSLYGSGGGSGTGGGYSQQHSAVPVMRAANLHPTEQQQETEMPAPPRYSPPYDAPSGPLSTTGAANGDNTTPTLNRPRRAQFKLWSRS